MQGLRWLLWGMFLKTVIADRLGIYVDLIYGNYASMSGKECLLGSVFYSLQIYSDFAGYSMMAMGLAKLLGFQLINNFQRPYFAISITDFWHRWHISLSRWLKDYVYIPLGGSRCGKIRNYSNILITFLISGVWHGANWTFILWGLFHGIAQIIEKAFHLQKNKGNNAVERVVRIAITMFIVNLLWIYFRMPTIDQTHSFLSHVITNFNGSIYWGQYKYAILLFPLVVKSLRDEFCPQCTMLLNYTIVRWTVYVFLFVMILLFGVLSSGQFIYVNF
jgi:D-alanyl-lipoteichoic acid acyltransferase DltB (MBOAT superfamily)